MGRRRRIPLDQLPELGQWDGPIHGELGVLAVDLDGSRVQCHACAGWYRSLAAHAWLAHHLSAEEYRAVFGLAARHGLVSPALADRLREHAERYLVPHHREAGELGRAVRARQGRTRHQTLRLETRLDPRWQQAMREVGRKIAGRLRDRGIVAALRSLDAAAFDRLTAKERDLVRLYYGLDPADPRPRSQRGLIETTGLGRREVDRLLRLGTARLLGPGALGLVASCAACGREFVRSAVSPARVTCSPACARARGPATPPGCGGAPRRRCSGRSRNATRPRSGRYPPSSVRSCACTTGCPSPARP